MKKILNIILIVFSAITLIILGLFIWGGDVPNAKEWTPTYTSALLRWAYILFGIGIVCALAFPIINLVTRPKQALKTVIGVLILGVFVLIAYALSDDTPMKLVGYSGPDNVPSKLIMSDTLLFTTYIFFIGAFVTIIGTEILKKFR